MNNHLLAATTYKLNGPGIKTTSTTGSVTLLEKIISTGIGMLTVIGVIYFIIQIILAGISMISSQGDPKELATAKKRLTNNILGLAIIIIAYGFGALLAKLMGVSSVFDLSTIFAPIK